MEIGTEENAEIVGRIYTAAMSALHSGRSVTPEQRLIYDVEHLMQEANSGASFEQFFRWASLEEIARTPSSLRAVGLNEIADLAEEAMRVAFPNGIPSTPEEKDDCTSWSSAQETSLQDMFTRLEEQNGHVMNVLGEYARRVATEPRR